MVSKENIRGLLLNGITLVAFRDKRSRYTGEKGLLPSVRETHLDGRGFNSR